MSFANRSASRMIRSNDLRRISARSRGFLPAQAGKAALAASTAALASSTVALATEAILFSVAGSITSKRPPSDDLRHLPPIHRSVATLARRFSYMGFFLRIRMSESRRCSCRSFTSPRRGEVGARSAPGEGVRVYREAVTPHLIPPPGGEREQTEYADRLSNHLFHAKYLVRGAHDCIARRTRSTIRSTVGSAMSSRMSAAGSGIRGVVIRTGGPSRS